MSSNVVQLRPQAERLLRPEAFLEELAQAYGIPRPTTRWLRYRMKDGLPSRKLLKRYTMIPVDPALEWLRANDYLGEH